jgi:microcystin-dependent protein
MDQYIGEIRMFGGNYAPEGWAFCNGQIISITQNEALYSLIGTTYGGDGQSTFALPDLRGRIPLHQGQNPHMGTTYHTGQMAGKEIETLTLGQVPAHTHGVMAASENGTLPSPANAFWAKNVEQYSTNSPDGTMSTEAISEAGGSQPHENMMPFLSISFIIALTGIYPSRD